MQIDDDLHIGKHGKESCGICWVCSWIAGRDVHDRSLWSNIENV